MLRCLLLAALTAAPIGDVFAAPQQAKKFIIDPERRVYDVGVNFAYQTTLWLPVDCAHPAIGDPEFFGVFFDKNKAKQRRFVISVMVEKPDSTTNVTFSCDEGVRLVLKVTQVQVHQATLSVEFAFDAAETERVRAALAKKEIRCEEDKVQALEDARLKFKAAAEVELVAGFLKRLVYGDEFTATKKNFVNVKSRNAVLIGDRGYILFEVQPRRDRAVVVDRIEVIDAESGALLPESRLVMPDRKVPGTETRGGVAVFENPTDAREFRLVVHLDGGQSIELDDIEL